MTEPSSRQGTKASDQALRSLLADCEDAPLASTLLGLLAQGRPVTTAAFADAPARAPEDVARRLSGWPNIERDADDAVIGFSGLTLRPTAHSFYIEGQRLHTWCAWDTLFLPALLGATARVRSTCPVTGARVELVVAPDAIQQAQPQDLYVSFPSAATTDTADLAGSFAATSIFWRAPRRPAAGRTPTPKARSWTWPPPSLAAVARSRRER